MPHWQNRPMGVRSRWKPENAAKADDEYRAPKAVGFTDVAGKRVLNLAPRDTSVFSTPARSFYYLQKHCHLQLVASYSTRTRKFGKPTYRLTVGTTVIDWEEALEADDLAELEAMVDTHAELLPDGSWSPDFLLLVEAALNKHLGHRHF